MVDPVTLWPSSPLCSFVVFHISSVTIRSKHVLVLFSLERGVCSICVYTQCQVSVAPHQNMSDRSERALRAVHIHISTSTLQQMECVVLVWTQLIHPQLYVAFYLIHTCKLLNWINNTIMNAGLGMFWIWLWVLNVGLVFGLVWAPCVSADIFWLLQSSQSC